MILDSRPIGEYRNMSIPGASTARARSWSTASTSGGLARHAGRRQLRRPHAQHHRRAVADQRRAPEPGRGARNGTMGWQLAGLKLARGPRTRGRRDRRRRARQGAQRRRRVAPRFGSHASTTRRWRGSGGGRPPQALSPRRARPRGIRRRPSAGRALGAGRAARTGDRRLCRHAQCPHRAGRRRRRTRADDRVLAPQMGWAEIYVLANALAGATLEAGPEPRQFLPRRAPRQRRLRQRS